jgi:sulfur carrier protein
MTVRLMVNGDPVTYPEPLTVADLVDQLVGSRRGVAVAVGGEVVARSRWETTELRDGDTVEVLHAVQGG